MTNSERHPAVVHLMGQFEHSHLPPDLAAISEACYRLAEQMYNAIDDNPELTTGLRKLLEAKDCFVRAAVANRRET